MSTYLIDECDSCQADVRLVIPPGMSTDPEQTLSGYRQIENGWCLNLTGGYGEFADDCFEENSPLQHVVLCHDCCLKIARMLPSLFPPGAGTHPPLANSGSDESCCEFNWSIDAHGCTVVGDGNGGWVERIAPSGEII